MLMKVVVENGVKKLVPLTADAGSGNPCGTIIAVYSNQVPYGYLPCNGVAFDTAQFPVLYALLGDNHTPDLRECTLKGIGESGRTVGAHVKAGGLAVGEFVDDRIQDHQHTTNANDTLGNSSQSASFAFMPISMYSKGVPVDSSTARIGTTTEVKAVGVNWCIKATSGINENQADNVLSALTPVDQVALNNLHSVTSNAVASSEEYFPKITNEVGTYLKATNVVLRPRSKGLATLNILDEDKTGLSVDFDFTSSLVRVFSIENGVTQGQKYIAMQSV